MPRHLPPLFLVVSLLLAGCVGFGPPGTSPNPVSPTPTSSPTETPWKSTAPDLSHDVTVDNQLDNTIELRVFVVHEGDRVFDENLSVSPGERDIYNTIEADPDGDDQFRIVAIWNGTREEAYLRTTNCYAGTLVVVNEDGELRVDTVLC